MTRQSRKTAPQPNPGPRPPVAWRFRDWAMI